MCTSDMANQAGVQLGQANANLRVAGDTSSPGTLFPATSMKAAKANINGVTAQELAKALSDMLRGVAVNKVG